MSTETTQTKSPLDGLKKAGQIFKEIYLTLLIFAGRLLAALYILGAYLGFTQKTEDVAYKLCVEDKEIIGPALNQADPVMEQMIYTGCGIMKQLNLLSTNYEVTSNDMTIITGVILVFLIEILAFLKTRKE